MPRDHDIGGGGGGGRNNFNSIYIKEITKGLFSHILKILETR